MTYFTTFVESKSWLSASGELCPRLGAVPWTKLTASLSD